MAELDLQTLPLLGTSYFARLLFLHATHLSGELALIYTLCVCVVRRPATPLAMFSYTAQPEGIASRSTARARGSNIHTDARVHRGIVLAKPVGSASGAVGVDHSAQAGATGSKPRTARVRRPADPFAAQAKASRSLGVDLTVHLVAPDDPTGPHYDAAAYDRAATDMWTQTDEMLAKAAPVRTGGVKTGIDAATQIEAGELWDFDREVDPLLAVLVSKTLESAYLQVLEEEELHAIAAARAAAGRADDSEAAALAQREAAVQARYERKAQAIAAAKERVAREQRLIGKVAAVMVGRAAVQRALQATMGTAITARAFVEPGVAVVATEFLPGVYNDAGLRCVHASTASRLVDDLLHSALAAGQRALQARDAQEAAAAQAAAAAERQRALEKRFRVRITIQPPALPATASSVCSGSGSDEEDGTTPSVLQEDTRATLVVGPILVQRAHTVRQVLDAVHGWVAAIVQLARADAGSEDEALSGDDGSSQPNSPARMPVTLPEDFELPEGSPLWAANAQLALTWHGKPLGLDSTLAEFSIEELVAGLGVQALIPTAVRAVEEESVVSD